MDNCEGELMNRESDFGMRDENARMQAFLAKHGIHARVKYIATGSLKGCWRLYDPTTRWTPELAQRLTDLGFADFDGRPLHKYSGNGGVFSVFVRGHNEMLGQIAGELVKIAKELTAGGYMGWYEAAYPIAWAISNSAWDRVTLADMGVLIKESTAILEDGIGRASRIAGASIPYELKEGYLQASERDKIRSVRWARLDFAREEQFRAIEKIFGKAGLRP